MFATAYRWLFPTENSDVLEVAGGRRDNKGDSQEMESQKAELRSPESLEADAGWMWEAVSAIENAVKQNRREVESGWGAALLCALKTSARDSFVSLGGNNCQSAN